MGVLHGEGAHHEENHVRHLVGGAILRPKGAICGLASASHLNTERRVDESPGISPGATWARASRHASVKRAWIRVPTMSAGHR